MSTVLGKRQLYGFMYLMSSKKFKFYLSTKCKLNGHKLTSWRYCKDEAKMKRKKNIIKQLRFKKNTKKKTRN